MRTSRVQCTSFQEAAQRKVVRLAEAVQPEFIPVSYFYRARESRHQAFQDTSIPLPKQAKEAPVAYFLDLRHLQLRIEVLGQVYYTPTHGSWLNLNIVEINLSVLQKRRDDPMQSI